MSNLAIKKLVTALFAFCLAIPATAQAAPEFDINYQSVYTGPHVFNVETGQPWVKELLEKSGGTIQPHFFMAAALAKPEEVCTSLMKGTLDMGSGNTNYDPALFPIAQHMALPYSYRDAIHSTALMNKLYETNPEIKAELDKIGKVLCLWASDRSALFSTKGKITSPADLKGKRVLFWNGNQVDQIKSWGGIPVQVSPNDTYMALQRGMGEMFFGPLPVGVAYKLMEVSKDITILPAFVTVIVTWMNYDLWNDLSPEQQQLVVDTVGPWGEKTGADLVRATNKDIETMKAAGCNVYTLTEEQIKPFKDADAAVILEFVNKEFKRLNVKKDAGEWIQYIHDLSKTL